MKNLLLNIFSNQLIKNIAIAIIYYVFAKFGLLMAFENTNASPVWPPSGIAFAAILVLGYQVWPGIMLGAFTANFVVFLANDAAGPVSSFVMSSCIAAGNTLEAITGCYLLRLFKSDQVLDKAKDFKGFFITTLLMCIVSCTIGSTVLLANEIISWTNYDTVWFTWWMGDVTGIIVLVPVLLTWWKKPKMKWEGLKSIEAIIIAIILTVYLYANFHGLLPLGLSNKTFLIFIILVWSVFSMNQWQSSLVVLLVSIFAVWNTLNDRGPFVENSQNESLLLLQTFLCVVSVTMMFLSTTLSERKKAEDNLKDTNDNLEKKIKERTVAIQNQKEELEETNSQLNKKINQQKQVEEALRNQRDLYETLLKVQSEMGEGVAITEGEKMVYVNPALCTIYGYAEDEILAMPSFLDIVVESDRKRLKERLQERFSDRIMSDTGETSVVRKDGQIINIEYSLKMIKINDRSQIVSIIRDITERKKTEAEIKQKTEDLADSNKELEQFAYVASHDLQEPLRTVISYLQLLEKRYKDKLGIEAEEFVNFAVNGARRMHRLINDLLAYSRITTKGKVFEKVDCAKVVNIVVDNLQSTIKENNAEIIIETELPVVTGDFWQMTQLFQNLIDNAIKYKVAETPKIRIAARKKGRSWLFSLKDNGIGIDAEYSERIFIIFQRLHTRDKYEGTGIGLAVCKKIVERHGGKIWVESELDRGATFYFTIKA